MPTGPKGEKRPRDTNQLAKLMVDILTGEVEDRGNSSADEGAAAARGRLGGIARKSATTPEQRKLIAKKAAQKRWRKS
jgi:hypothetical protein